MEVLSRHPECYREGGSVPPAKWPMFGEFRICHVAILRRKYVRCGICRGPCARRTVARLRRRGGEGEAPPCPVSPMPGHSEDPPEDGRGAPKRSPQERTGGT